MQSSRTARDILEFKKRIMVVIGSSVGWFVVLVFLYGLFGQIK